MPIKDRDMIFNFDKYKYGDKQAILYKDQAIDYSSLSEKISKLAGALHAIGIKKRDRIAVMLNNCPEFVICFFSIIKIGAVPVLLNPKIQKEELKFYFSDSLPAAIIFNEDLIDMVFNANLKAALLIIVGDKGKRADCFSLNHLLSCAEPFKEEINILPDDELIWQYSTGSTGRPKRVCRTYYHILSEVGHYTKTIRVESYDIFLAVVPLFHSHGLFNSMLSALCNGCTIVIMEEFNPRDVLSHLETEGITIFPGVPFMFKILSEVYFKYPRRLSSLRLCFSAGALLPPEVSKNFHKKFGIYVVQLYGSTETGSVSINLYDESDNAFEDKLESVGFPMKGVKVKIFEENGKSLPPGEIGEIGIKSEAAIKCYYGLDHNNRESFRWGYFFPGDLGKVDVNGRLYIRGRKKLMINVSGNKVDPAEVENVIVSHPKVKEAAVLGVKDQNVGEIVKAVIVREENTSIDEEEILNHCRNKIAEFKIPKIIEFRREIPKSLLGKVLKKYLQ